MFWGCGMKVQGVPGRFFIIVETGLHIKIGRFIEFLRVFA